mmetsp:Transcript_68911/g.149957  ORF Transcript_68911/g.149957 Transcript_68911/m.149957 type:complete len:146 (+) Transcript_68911:71-508(+)|eukprot:CAMPEP_0170581792 /NCGR_PEP_ID=MMETSP0224-20130122/7231_1 /TAXON_ID=285029 /ORGANISM="Togula jolla, Strain CCCM 725" /LENGTH=145 /DNA_ID=CAMNT_0010904957 /DNA_START=43 /DNA_END=480 /DNA_ORIENTATION=+
MDGQHLDLNLNGASLGRSEPGTGSESPTTSSAGASSTRDSSTSGQEPSQHHDKLKGSSSGYVPGATLTALAAGPGPTVAQRTRLRAEAQPFRPKLPFVPAADVARAWQRSSRCPQSKLRYMRAAEVESVWKKYADSLRCAEAGNN